MSKIEANANATEFLVQALADIGAGNLFLAKSLLRDALRMSNKAGTKKLSGKIMRCMHLVQTAR